MTSEEFLSAAFRAAALAKHIFPDYAACEVALESNWGKSLLCRKANNLFGHKQSARRVYATLTLATREFINGSWVRVNANWISYPDWDACFDHRMVTLARLQDRYPDY